MDRSIYRTGAPAILALVIGLSSSAGSTSENPAVRKETAGVFPTELAFSARSIAHPFVDAPALSSDGQWVAYSVYTPPPKRPDRDLPPGKRYFSNGVPGGVVGHRLHVTAVATGKSHRVGPEGTNSWRASWSPDSRWLGFACDAGGPPQLWVYDRTTGRSRRVSTVALRVFLWPGGEARWAPDGSEVFVPLLPRRTPAQANSSVTAAGPSVTVYRTRPPGGDAERTAGPEAAHFHAENSAALAAIRLRTGTVRVLVAGDADPTPSALRLSPSGRWVSYLTVIRAKRPTALRQLTYDLAVVPATGGAPRVIAWDLEAPDDLYGGTYRWHPTRDLLVYLKGQRLWLVDCSATTTLAPRPLAAHLGDIAPVPLLFTRDGKSLLVGAQPEDRSDYAGPRPMGVVLIPIDGGAPRRFTAEPELVRRGEALAATQETLWQPEPHYFTLAVANAGNNRSAFVRLDTQSGTARVTHTEAGRFRCVGSGADHGPLVAVYQNYRTPPDLWQFDEILARHRRVSRVEPRLDGVAVGRLVRLETGSGREMVGTTLLLPPDVGDRPRLPAVVFVYPGGRLGPYGTLFGGGSPASLPALLLSHRGYAVVLPDLLLSPEGSPGDPARETTEALMPQLGRLAELGYIDPERVGLVGQSFGGYGACAVLTQSDRFRAAVAISGLYDLPGLYGWMMPNGTNFLASLLESGQGRMGSPPWSDLPRYLANSPYYQAHRIQAPLLLIHGERDEACPVEDARKLFSAARRLGKDVELAVYADEGHAVTKWSLANATDATRRILEFLGRHLGGRA